MFYYLAGFFHTQCFLHFLFLQHNIPSRTSAALVGSNLTLPMSISRNLHAILLFQLHELDKRRMNFWVTIWKITIACLGFSPRFHSAYCKWISTRASIMDRILVLCFYKLHCFETSERLYKYSTCTCIQPFSSVASRNGIQAVAIIWS